MKKDSFIITAEGYLKLEEELNELKNVRRPQIIKALKDARAQGDLSENSDYDAARDAQGKVESRIKELEYRLEHVTVIEAGDTSEVRVGSTVEIEYIDDKLIRVKYKDVKAVTPGQACVVYLGEQCLMGGIIKQVFKDGKEIWYLK